jgi:hypothetical protein
MARDKKHSKMVTIISVISKMVYSKVTASSKTHKRNNG